jgi:Acetyltransferase (GNAT) domain
LLSVEATVLAADSVPSAAEPELVLWNTQAFYDLRPEQAPRRRRYDHHDAEGRFVGALVAAMTDEGACAGFGAPFGGFDLARPNETIANVEGLVDASLESLAADGVDVVEVRAKPGHYGSNEAALQFVLLNRGFEVAACDLNAYLDLEPVDSVDAYAEHLKPAARKMLRRSRALGLSAVQVPADDEAAWAEAYEVLRRNRVDRGRPMRLELDYVRRIRDAFPGHVRLLALLADGAMCAAALVYRVAAGRDLVQYWGDAGHDLAVSPMNHLVATVVEHGLAAGTRTIDIGISSEHGVPNHGLIQFKRSVGCLIEPRLELVRSSAAKGSA